MTPELLKDAGPHVHPPVPQLMLATLAVALFLILAFTVRVGPAPGDEAVTRALAGHCPSVLLTHPSVHQPCPFGMQRVLHDLDDSFTSKLLGLPVWTSFVLLIAAGLWLGGNRPASLLLLFTDAAAEGTTAVAKVLVARLPPPDTDNTGVLASLAHLEFPSGHLVRATVTLGLLLVAVIRLRPAWRLPAWLVYVTVLGVLGATRVAGEAHWPSDIVGSFLLGGAWLGFVLSFASAGRWPKRFGARRGVPHLRKMFEA